MTELEKEQKQAKNATILAMVMTFIATVFCTTMGIITVANGRPAGVISILFGVLNGYLFVNRLTDYIKME